MDDPVVRKQMLPLFPITLLGVAVDLWLRPTLDLRLMQWAWWGLSVAFSLVMWQGLFVLSSRLRPRWQAAFVLVVGLVTSVLALIWLGFHEIFYCWPTAYALVHSAGHPREAWGYILNEADWGDAVVWVAIVAVIVGWWYYKLRPSRRLDFRSKLSPPVSSRQSFGCAVLGWDGGFWRGASPREHHGAGCSGCEISC